jgi:RNA polymerase sigma-70 factor, ECF subfamily
MKCARSPEPALDAAAPADPFVEFVREHTDLVWRTLHALGVARVNVDDALQDVFVVAFRRWSDYEERGTARAWLFAITRRVAAQHRRTRALPSPEPLELVAGRDDLEETLRRREAEHMVHEFLGQLSASRREVFLLSDVEGWSAPEVALALDLKLNTVYSRLRRARGLFERYLARRTGGRR